jgi:5,10-methylenetetrahydromethanopterin reductase
MDSPRVLDAIGPWTAVLYHGAWQTNPDAVLNLPNGKAWRDAVDALRPAGERHLAAHEGHITDLTERDRVALVGSGMLGAIGWTGTPEQIRARAEAAHAAGATEIMYTPAGPDLARELRTWADALGS